MKKLVKIFTLVSAFAAISCSPEEFADYDGTVKFSVDVSKATDTAFENGDAISLFAGNPVNAVNVKLTLSGSSAIPSQPLYWGEGQTMATSFNAVYPYSASFSSYNVDFEVQSNQSSEAAFKASDLMTASTSQTPGNTVALNFSHKLAKLTVNIVNDSGCRITGVTVNSVKNRFNSGTGEASGSASVKACRISDTNWAVILAPGVTQGTVTVFTDIGSYTYKGEFALYSGKKSECNISLSGTASAGAAFSCTVNDWENGGSFTFTQDGTTPTPPIGDNTGEGNTIKIEPLSTALTWNADTHTTYGAGFKGTGHGVTVAYYKYNSATDLVSPTSTYTNIKVYKDAVLVIRLDNGAAIKSVSMKCSGTSAKSYTSNMQVIGGGSIVADEPNYSLSWTGSTTELIAVANVSQVRPETLEITY